MADDRLHFSQSLEVSLHEVRDGYLTGHTHIFGKGFDLEAFRCVPGSWNEPDGKRHRRHREILAGLAIDDVVLYQVELPGFDGEWVVIFYPGENEHFQGNMT